MKTWKVLINWGILIIFIIILNKMHGLEIDYYHLIFVFSVSIPFIIIALNLTPSKLEKLTKKNVPLTLVLILRLLPVFEVKVLDIKISHQLRGIELDGVRGIQNYPKLVIPSVLMALRWIDDLYNSLKLRGYE